MNNINRLGDLNDLPNELKDQLVCLKNNTLVKQILNIFKELDGVANIDEIVVHLYRKHKKIYTRPYINNAIFRMVKLEHIERINGKKGVYALNNSYASHLISEGK